MKRLTEKTNQGTWSLKGVPWMMLHAGAQMTEEVRKSLYGALCKLMHYEDTGLAPDQIWEMDELYREKCEEVNRLKAELAAEHERLKGLEIFYKDVSEMPDCNTCRKRNCEYRPRLGGKVRFNCPLYEGGQQDVQSENNRL